MQKNTQLWLNPQNGVRYLTQLDSKLLFLASLRLDLVYILKHSYMNMVHIKDYFN